MTVVNNRYITVYYTTHNNDFDDCMYLEQDNYYVKNERWQDTVAAEIAEDYYSNHDGWDYPQRVWEDGIPFTLWIKDENGNPEKLGTWNVTMEPRPNFTAYKEGE